MSRPRRCGIATAADGVLPLLIATGILLWPRPALPQEALEEVVVLGSYLPGDAYRTGSQLSVNRQDLDRIEPADAENLLSRLPGVSVFRPGGAGGVSEVFLRGAESNFTSVYVDGIRLNNSANTRGGSFDFSTLAVGEIERLDVAMGAMSAIYGSDAMAGVIRIRTAIPAAGRASAYTEAGTEHDWRAGAAGAVGVGDGAALGLRVSARDGGRAVAGSDLEQGNVTARLAGTRGSDDWQVNLRYVNRDRSSYPEVSGGPEYAVLPDLETSGSEEFGLSATTEWTLSDRWRSELVASWARLQDDTETPAVPPGVLDGQPAFTSHSDYRRGELLWINRIAAGDRSDLALGLNLVDERGRDDGTVDLGFATLPNGYRLDRTTASAFAELGTAWSDRWRSTLALRADRAGGDLHGSGKLGIARELGTGGRIWARLANGFKLPSFFALGNPLFGNPDLTSEKVRSVELGYDADVGKRARVGIALFTSRYRDLVDFDFETFRNVNVGEIDIDGIFVHLQAELLPTLRLAADATLSDIASASGPLRRRPEKTGGLNLIWQPSARWSADLSARYVGKRLITSIPTGDVVDGAYLTVDGTVRYRISKNLSAWLAVDNALDADFQDAPGFPAPGKRARLGADIRF